MWQTAQASFISRDFFNASSSEIKSFRASNTACAHFPRCCCNQRTVRGRTRPPQAQSYTPSKVPSVPAAVNYSLLQFTGKNQRPLLRLVLSFKKPADRRATLGSVQLLSGAHPLLAGQLRTFYVQYNERSSHACYSALTYSKFTCKAAVNHSDKWGRRLQEKTKHRKVWLSLARQPMLATWNAIKAYLLESARSANSINMLKQFQNPNRVKINAPNWLRNLIACFPLGAAIVAGRLPSNQTAATPATS